MKARIAKLAKVLADRRADADPDNTPDHIRIARVRQLFKASPCKNWQAIVEGVGHTWGYLWESMLRDERHMAFLRDPARDWPAAFAADGGEWTQELEKLLLEARATCETARLKQVEEYEHSHW